jgi:hypothetical protein
MQAHWSSVLVIMFTLLVAPFYWFLVLPVQKAIKMAWITAVLATIMLTINIFDVTGKLGPAGGALIGFMWIVPPLIVWLKRDWFKGLNQKPIVGLQIFRLIGAFFLVEMFRGNIPGSFAWPAGVGDIMVGLFAVVLFLNFDKIPESRLVVLIVLGILDFLSAFFFGFTSFEGPAQLFAVGFDNKANLFPTGVIPFFLVPYAITYHIISLINLNNDTSQ